MPKLLSWPLHRYLLALVLLGAAGMLVELLLLKHYEDAWQWAPLVLLVITLACGVVLWRGPAPRALATFRAMMWLSVLAGGLGVVLHLKGNVEFALERDPDLSGVSLAWKVLRGATPALAPGALAQLGLLGLLFTHQLDARERGHIRHEDVT